MITTLNLNRETTSILENAFAIGYAKKQNQIWSAQFSMPLDDPKNEKIKMLQYVEIEDDETEEYIGLFRLIPKRTTKNRNREIITYECEHVLGTLIGSTLFKYHQLSNYTTTYVLNWLLNQQKEPHWQLGTVEFTRYFHYSWENENLLSALFSVPRPFDENYRWTWDTKNYPWTLNLVRVDTEPTARIAEGHNLIGLEIEENPMSLWNRVYPLGSGEGVNQLDIIDVNNGIPYVENPSSIAKYGLYEYTWADQRFTDQESLLATAKKMLDNWSEPLVYWEVDAAELSSITGVSMDKLTEGKVVRLMLDDYPTIDLSIVGERKTDITGDRGSIQLELGNIQTDLGDTAAEVERKQQINELYSQGATNILNYGYQDNADADIPANIPFYLDSDVVNINTCELTFRTKRFRAYSQATEGGGAIVESTSSGGGTTRSTTSGGGTTQTTTSGGSVSTSTASGGGSSQTSSSGGGTSTSTASGGASTQTSSSGGGTSTSTNAGGSTTQTSSANGSHRHVMFQTQGSSPMGSEGVLATTGSGTIQLGGSTPTQSDISTLSAADNHSHSVSVPSHSHGFSTPNHSHSVGIPSHTHGFSTPDHSHSVSIPSHTHNFTIPSHSHDVTIPSHSHDVTIPNHSHEITIPNHIHQVAHKITELMSMPSAVEVRVDGNLVPETAISQNRLNIVDYLSKDNRGKINRGNHEITIKPVGGQNGLARIEADLILRVFIRSQLGGNY